MTVRILGFAAALAVLAGGGAHAQAYYGDGTPPYASGAYAGYGGGCEGFTIAGAHAGVTVLGINVGAGARARIGGDCRGGAPAYAPPAAYPAAYQGGYQAGYQAGYAGPNPGGYVDQGGAYYNAPPAPQPVYAPQAYAPQGYGQPVAYAPPCPYPQGPYPQGPYPQGPNPQGYAPY